MATPVMTTSDPSQYSDYKSQLNEILYSKKKYAEGQANKNQGTMDWAANNATQYYNQLPTELASQVKGMDVNGLTNFYNMLTQTQTPLQTYQQGLASNPYTPQVDQAYEQLANYKPPVNPFDAQMQSLLLQLTNLINTPLADPTTTPQFAAAQQRLDRQKGVQINDAAEVLGGSGLARSSIVTDRAQDISQQFTEYMETQVIPGIVEQMQNEKNSKMSGLGALLESTGGQQTLFDGRSKEEFDRMGKLYDALVGREGAFNDQVQRTFENTLAQGADKREQQKFEWQKKVDEANIELSKIDSALQRTNTLGRVSAQDAAILGVPAGTPSFQAANAVAQRKHELEMQKKDNEAAMARLNKQIAAEAANTQKRIDADKEQARLAREAQEGYEKERLLLEVWDRTGVAPEGLDRLNIQAGTPISAEMDPDKALAQLKLDEAKALKEETDLANQNIPILQKEFGTNKVTAEAIWHLYDNPNREAALADYKSSKKALKDAGVDLKKIEKAIDNRWPPAEGGKDAATESIDHSVDPYKNDNPEARDAAGKSLSNGMGAPGGDMWNWLYDMF